MLYSEVTWGSLVLDIVWREDMEWLGESVYGGHTSVCGVHCKLT